MKTLLIVESPAKSKTIEKLLGSDYTVLSSFGHIRDLDKEKGTNSLGIEVDNNFRPIYKIMKDKNKQIKAIQDKIKTVDKVLLASDEDREGEAIAWHCAIVFKLSVTDKNRICFHEITKTALEHAVANPRTINMDMVNSQQGRRILDRLVGFKLSPLLWKYIAPKLSAGRVQSAVLKIIVDQEKDINKFTDKKYYKTIGTFDKDLVASLNKNFEIKTDIMDFMEHCKTAIFSISNIDKITVQKIPPPPYTTSTIQQDIGSRFGIGSKIVMNILQKLYEAGHITYHRTDSTNLSEHIQIEIKNYILDKFGSKYSNIRNYKSKIKCAQEAHEAIRPTHINIEHLPDLDGLDNKIYEIIWKRTVATQMSASITDVYTININISDRDELFISKANKLIFDGYKKIYDDTVKKDDDNEIILDNNFIVDNIKKGDLVKYIKITTSEKYQTPPVRYTEASLVKKMEKVGVGRPSTYASIIETIFERKYAVCKDIKGKKVEVINIILEKNNIKEKKDNMTIGGEKKKLIPTDLGIKTNEFLENNFMEVIDSNFTASMEQKLDNVANGTSIWTNVIGDFYNDFNPNVIKLNDVKVNNNDKKRFLGNNSDGIPVYAYIAKYGAVFQIGDGTKKSTKYIPIEEPLNVNTVTLDDLNSVKIYPKNIGIYKDNEILLKNGKYGLYLTYNNINYKVLTDYDENITLDDAIKCIEYKNIVTSYTTSTGFNILIKSFDEYIIKNGKYGHYIHYNKKFYNIPKTYNIETITKSDCENIIKTSKK